MKTNKTIRRILSILVIGMVPYICACSDDDDPSGGNGETAAEVITKNIKASTLMYEVDWSGPGISIQIGSNSLNLMVWGSDSGISYIGQVQKITDIVSIPTGGYSDETSAIVNGGYVIRAFDSDENRYKYLRVFIFAAQNSIYTVQYQEYGN